MSPVMFKDKSVILPFEDLDKTPASIAQDSPFYDTYSLCFDLQTEAEKSGCRRDLIEARILGHLILQAPTIAAQEYAANEINRYSSISGGLHALADGLWRNLFAQFMRAETEFPTVYVSRDELRPKSTDKLTLLRDDYRCFITKSIDPHYLVFMVNKEEEKKLEEEGVQVGMVMVNRIVPKIKDRPLTEIAGIKPSTVREFIKEYGGVDIIEEKSYFESTRNHFVVNYSVAEMFNRLCLWLKEAPMGRWEVFRGYPQETRPPIVTDTEYTSYADIFPPDPRYFKLHGLMSSVAHRSGAGDEMYRAAHEDEDFDMPFELLKEYAAEQNVE